MSIIPASKAAASPAVPRSAMRGIWAIGIFSVVYAVVRYVIFDTKYVENIPCFILNKAVGMAASFFLVCAFWNRCRNQLEDAGAYFRAAFTAVIVHIPLSLLLLRPGYFPEFFVRDGSRLKSWGEMMVLCGAVGLALLWQNSRDRFHPSGRQKLAVSMLAVIFCHAGAMGICRGVNINAKHAYLPPMWMLSLVVIGAGILALLWFARRRSGAKVNALRVLFEPDGRSIAPKEASFRE